MDNVDKMLVDYYQSEGFRQDLSEWVAAPRRSVPLRQHIVVQMNTNRAALGRKLNDELQSSQRRFVAGDMSYDDMLHFIQEYVSTIRIAAR